VQPASPLLCAETEGRRPTVVGMPLPAVDLIPLLAAAGAQSQTFMPFVLILAPIVLVLLLLFVFGRQRRRNRDHQK
jgi:hypothetical protein